MAFSVIFQFLRFPITIMVPPYQHTDPGDFSDKSFREPLEPFRETCHETFEPFREPFPETFPVSNGFPVLSLPVGQTVFKQVEKCLLAIPRSP